MGLSIEIELEEDGRWLVEVPELSGDIERQLPGQLAQGGNELLQQHILQGKEALSINGVFEARVRGLVGQIVLVNRTAADQLEDRIATQHIVVVLVGVVGQDAVDPCAAHFQESVANAAMAAVDQGSGKLLRQPQLLVQLPEGKGTDLHRWKSGLLTAEPQRELTQKKRMTIPKQTV